MNLFNHGERALSALMTLGLLVLVGYYMLYRHHVGYSMLAVGLATFMAYRTNRAHRFIHS